MKEMIMKLLLILCLMNIKVLAQKKSYLPEAKNEQINGWIEQYSSFIRLDDETKQEIFTLYKKRFLEKDSIHNVTSLTANEKLRLKKEVDQKTNKVLQNLLSAEDFLNIRCFHLTIFRLKKISFITDLGDIQRERLLYAMRDMRYKNSLLIMEYGKNNPTIKDKMRENRQHCSYVEQQVFSDEMYKHLYKLNLLTVVDWSNTNLEEAFTENVLEGYNILEPDQINR